MENVVIVPNGYKEEAQHAKEAIFKKGKEYLDGLVPHEEHHEWLCNFLQLPESLVPVSLKKLLASQDRHFNDIPLALWDRQHEAVKQYLHIGIPWALSDSVCCLKHLARRMVTKEL